MAELDYFDREELKKVKTIDGILQGHPDNDLTPGIEAVTGSLGQGLSVSVGMALGLKLDKSTARVYCVIGDGELNEGQIWEAAMAAAVYKVDNLCAILDNNKVQATDTTDNLCSRFINLKEKWASFGWHVSEIDGHDARTDIMHALNEASAVKGTSPASSSQRL